MNENDQLEEGKLCNIVDRGGKHPTKDESGNSARSADRKRHVSTLRNDRGEAEEIPIERNFMDYIVWIKGDSTKWDPLVIICALLLLVGVVVGIIVLSQTGRQYAPYLKASSDETYHPSITPSSSQYESNDLSNNPSISIYREPNIPSSYLPSLPTIVPSEESTLYPITTLLSTEPSMAPSISSTQTPTLIPSNQPSLYPTQPSSPSPSTQPSLPDTKFLPIDVPIEILVNDVCTGAFGPLQSDFSSNFGTLANAGVDNVDRCGDVQSSGPGVWYYTIGTGGEMMAHTCLDTEFNSKISIFRGACDKPVCIEANDDFCGSGTSQSAVSWSSDYGELYYILVTGNPDFQNGSFNIVIGSRSNDECATAIGPLTVEDPMPVQGSTLGATANDISCDDFVNDSNSVWYLAHGTGGELTVDLCEKTNFSVRITIFTGTCTGLECIAVSSLDNCIVTWNSELTRSYYILIGGQKSDDIGDFSLQLSTTGVPDNNECKNAIGPLGLDGIPIKGSTAFATVDVQVPFCSSAVTANGLWYYVEGNGSIIQASLCESLSYDTRISVYRGSCIYGDGLTNLVCIDANDDFCGRQSLVTWNSEIGATYYILVHGYLSESGDFSLIVTEL